MANKKEVSNYNRLQEILEDRKRKGLESSRYWLARESKIGYITLSKYFYGQQEPTLPTLFQIAQVLKIHPKELLKDPTKSKGSV